MGESIEIRVFDQDRLLFSDEFAEPVELGPAERGPGVALHQEIPGRPLAGRDRQPGREDGLAQAHPDRAARRPQGEGHEPERRGRLPPPRRQRAEARGDPRDDDPGVLLGRQQGRPGPARRGRRVPAPDAQRADAVAGAVVDPPAAWPCRRCLPGGVKEGEDGRRRWSAGFRRSSRSSSRPSRRASCTGRPRGRWSTSSGSTRAGP